jgi:predicted dehydrogenase
MGFPKPLRVTGKASTNFAKGYEIPGGWGEWNRELFGVEDHACGFVHFDNGATMVIEASWLQHQKELEEMNATLFGRKGTVQWPTGEYQSTVSRVFNDGIVTPGALVEKPRTNQILAFAEAIRAGKPSPVPPTQTIYVTAILEGIYRSSELGHEVEITLK